ncbi:hypothetical protein [Fodinibius sp. SL11]|uniref:hypothetical protein n=1 Tax=Fodinibius sp. SL11 TaxID=3425690 RepID=UPI003F881C83
MSQKRRYSREEFRELMQQDSVRSADEFKRLQEGKVYEIWCSDALKPWYKRSVIKIMTEKKCDICHFKHRLLWPGPKGKIIESPRARMVAFREVSKQLQF